MVARGVLTVPSTRSVVQGRAAWLEPSGWGMVMERMRVGIFSMLSCSDLSVKPTTCSIPSNNRMKQSSHLHSSRTNYHNHHVHIC